MMEYSFWTRLVCPLWPKNDLGWPEHEYWPEDFPYWPENGKYWPKSDQQNSFDDSLTD